MRGKGFAVLAGEAHRLKRGGAVALGEALTVRAGEQGVVAVFRGGKVEQRLQQTVDVRCLEQILAADDVSDVLGGIVEGDGEVIARRGVLAGEDDVALRGGGGGNGEAVVVPP